MHSQPSRTGAGFLGLDIGTGSCKALVFDETGRELASARRAYSLQSPEPGWAELDAEELSSACLAVIREAAGKSPVPVRGLCISSQGEAFVLVDREGRALCNAMVSSDRRAAEVLGPWVEQFGAERLYSITGHTPHPLFTLFKLLWVKRQRPEWLQRCSAVCCMEEFIQLRLGLRPAISYPLAGRTMLFDVTRHEWSEEILQALDLLKELFARPLPSGSLVGEIPARCAAELGLPSGVKVVTGGHDQPMAALGAGVLSAGSAMYATGSVECICPAFDQPQFSPSLQAGNLCSYDYTLPGMATTVAYSLTGGNILTWYQQQFASGRPVDQLLKELPTAPTGLLVLPYFTPSGTPYFELDLPGAVLGLRLTTSAGEFLKGLLEGVVLEMRLNLEILEMAGWPVKDLTLVGGGARSPELCQLKADVLNRPLYSTEICEAGCFAAAMLACAAVTGIPVQDLVSSIRGKAVPISPDPARAEIYTASFARYRQLYPQLKPLYSQR